MDKKYLILAIIYEIEAVVLAVGLGKAFGQKGYMTGLLIFTILSIISMLSNASMLRLTMKHGRHNMKAMTPLNLQMVTFLLLLVLVELASRHFNGHAYLYENITAIFRSAF